MLNLKKKNSTGKLIDTENRLVLARGRGRGAGGRGEGSSKVQTPSY